MIQCFEVNPYFCFRALVTKNPCEKNSTCQSGFTDLVYHCLCATGFKGQTCDEGKNCQYIFIIIGDDVDL